MSPETNTSDVGSDEIYDWACGVVQYWILRAGCMNDARCNAGFECWLNLDPTASFVYNTYKCIDFRYILTLYMHI